MAGAIKRLWKEPPIIAGRQPKDPHPIMHWGFKQKRPQLPARYRQKRPVSKHLRSSPNPTLHASSTKRLEAMLHRSVESLPSSQVVKTARELSAVRGVGLPSDIIDSIWHTRPGSIPSTLVVRTSPVLRPNSLLRPATAFMVPNEISRRELLRSRSASISRLEPMDRQDSSNDEPTEPISLGQLLQTRHRRFHSGPF
jgi:hypothetical protein